MKGLQFMLLRNVLSDDVRKWIKALGVVAGLLTGPHALAADPDPAPDGPAAEKEGDKVQNRTEKDSASVNTERYRALETLARGIFYLESLYYDPNKVDQSDVVAHALRGITASLDPHTVYMPKEAFKQLTIDTQGKFGGVGIIVSSDNGKLLVVSPIEDTPAFRAGIKAGDEIIEIDGSSVKKLKPGLATEKMRGEPGSTLELTIVRKGEKKPQTYKLVREVINVQSVRGLDLGRGVLYARISSFQDNTTQELKNALDTHLKKNPLTGLILDLRDNPGGLLDQAVGVSDLFIESGVIVSTVGRGKDDIEREFAHKRGTYLNFPIIVLINSGSASASEIVAGALQDHERAFVLGTTSFGKGSVQTLVSLPDGSGLKITVARYFTPKDRSIQARGIEPDFVVDQESSSPKAGSEVAGTSGPVRKESDLKGHIESENLSDMAKSSGLLTTIKKWPEQARNDKQLVTAYTYLHGWSIFRKVPTASGTTKTPSSPASR
jgi:carboxyl-terminal processing protease